MIVFIKYRDNTTPDEDEDTSDLLPEEIEDMKKIQDEKRNKTLIINPNCNIGQFSQYIRQRCNIADDVEFHLSEHDTGEMKEMMGLPLWTMATEILEARKSYTLVTTNKT